MFTVCDNWYINSEMQEFYHGHLLWYSLISMKQRCFNLLAHTSEMWGICVLWNVVPFIFSLWREEFQPHIQKTFEWPFVSPFWGWKSCKVQMWPFGFDVDKSHLTQEEIGRTQVISFGWHYWFHLKKKKKKIIWDCYIVSLSLWYQSHCHICCLHGVKKTVTAWHIWRCRWGTHIWHQ